MTLILIGTLTAGSALAHVGTNYGAVHNPPHEYVCDNDPGVAGCWWSDAYGTADLVTGSTHGWSNDYRWEKIRLVENSASQWQFYIQDQPWQLSEDYQIWAHIPDTTHATAETVMYYWRRCAAVTDRPNCPPTNLFSSLGYNQLANNGSWIALHTSFSISDSSYFSVSASNATDDPALDGDQNVIYDAIDIWDGE